MGCTIVEMTSGRPPWDDLGFEDELQAAHYIANTTHHPPIPHCLSPPAVDLLRQCFAAGPTDRASSLQLQGHPWIMGSAEAHPSHDWAPADPAPNARPLPLSLSHSHNFRRVSGDDSYQPSSMHSSEFTDGESERTGTWGSGVCVGVSVRVGLCRGPSGGKGPREKGLHLRLCLNPRPVPHVPVPWPLRLCLRTEEAVVLQKGGCWRCAPPFLFDSDQKGGKLRSAICCNFAIFRNFPQFFRNCFRPVHFACWLVPFAFANNCCRTICLNVFLPPKRVNYALISW